MTTKRRSPRLTVSPAHIGVPEVALPGELHAAPAHRPRRVLFVGPSPLAPMAAVCFSAFAVPTRATVSFATSGGKSGASRAPVEALMREVGLLAGRPLERALDAALIAATELVVTIGRAVGLGRGRDPRLPSVPRRHEHWLLPAPGRGESPHVRARKLRDALRARVAMLVFMEGWGRPEASRDSSRLTPPSATRYHLGDHSRQLPMG